MIKVLLVGCGAEIGSLLVGMINPEKDGIEISAILTHSIPSDPRHPELRGVDSLAARVILAQPQLLDHVTTTHYPETLIVKGRNIPVFWGDASNFDLRSMPITFDVCLVATSEKQVKDVEFMKRFTETANYVIGVAESDKLPAIYYPLIDTPDQFFGITKESVGSHRVFCLGSCQSNGWQSVLRGLFGVVEMQAISSFQLCASEIDIIHPDTPNGRLSTKSIAARDQDARNNLRPGFSQVETVMKRLFPHIHTVNTISLRTLITPPSYQVCRFFFRYNLENRRRLNHQLLIDGFESTSLKRPEVLKLAKLPLGSRGFEQCESAAIILPQKSLFRYADDPFRLGTESSGALSELIVQAYVHNTRGYCRTIIEAIKYLAKGHGVRIFPIK